MNKENSIPGPTILWSEIKDQKVKSVDGKDMGKIKVFLKIISWWKKD